MFFFFDVYKIYHQPVALDFVYKSYPAKAAQKADLDGLNDRF